MADLLRLYNDSPTKASAPAAGGSSSGPIRLYDDAPAKTTSPAPPAASPATPGSPKGTPMVQTTIPSLPLPTKPSQPVVTTGQKYGGSNITDQSNKPLETFKNDKVQQSQLLDDRVYPGFDPTKPQKLDASHLHNDRMPESVSAPIKKQLGGAYSDELDHKIALELSGSNNPANLKIEPGRQAGLSAAHDQLENQLAKHVVNGELSLLDAQRALAKAKGYTLREDLAPGEVDQNAGKPLIEGKPKTEIPNSGSSIGQTLLDAYPSTMQTTADLQMDPNGTAGDPHKAISDYMKTINDSAGNFGASLAEELKAWKAKDSASVVGSDLKTAVAGFGWATSPITALFSAANDIPTLRTFSKLLTLPFALMGDAGPDTAKVLLNHIPNSVLSPQAKDKVVDGLGAAFGLAGQIAIGHVSEAAGKALEAKFGATDAATIVKKAEEIAKQPATPPTEAPAAEHVDLPGKPLADKPAPPTAERAGFVNPEAFKDTAKEAIDKFKESRADAKAGEDLRTSFTGERDSRVAETNQLRDQLEKGLSPKEQEALTLMRDFKNRPEELDQFANGTHPSLTDQAAIDRVGSLKDLIELAKNPTENMKAADAAMTKYFETHLAEGKKLGFLDSNIKNDEYISHLLQPKEDAGKVVSKRGNLRTYKIGRDTPFSKERTYPTVLHAIANGVEPRTLNALDALTIYGDKHATAAATHILIKQLKDSGVAKWGSHGSENIPADWKPIAPENNRLFQNQRAFVDETGKPGIAHQSLFAPEKVVEALRPLTDPDFTDRIPGFKTSKFYQGYLKAAQLGLSAFHLKAMNLSALGNEGLTGLVRSYATDMKSPDFLDTERGFIKAGGTTPILGRSIEAYRELKPSSLPSRADILRSLPVVKQLDQISGGISHLTFDIVQRKFKVTDFAMKDAKWITEHPDASPAEHFAAQRAFAKEVNATYGGLNWEGLGINKMTQSILRFGMLAPDWTFSNWFNVKGAFEGGPGGKAARAFWIRSAITGVALSQATSILMSGKPSKNWTNVYLGKDKTGKDVYQNVFFAGAPSDAINLMNNMHDYGPVSGFAQTLLGKSNAFIRTGIQTATNRNYIGQTIVPKGAGFIAGTGRLGLNAGSQLLPVPFSVTNLVQMMTDPTKQFSQKEYVATLLGGARPRHVVPDGQREITSGKKKGTLAPALPHQRNSTINIIKGAPLNKPKPKK
jgi:hypothetical protein